MVTGDFKMLQKLQHTISPFVASLRLFKIKQLKAAIYLLYEFKNGNLIENWAETTLEQVRESGIMKMGSPQNQPGKTRDDELIGTNWFSHHEVGRFFSLNRIAA